MISSAQSIECGYLVGVFGEETARTATVQSAFLAGRGLCERAEAQHESDDDVAQTVLDRLLDREGEYPSLTEMAKALAMSDRTLNRKLKAQGTSYQMLLDDVRQELAVWTGCCTGESVVLGLGEADGDVLAAGASRLPGSGEDDVLRPMVMRYTSDLVRLWKGRSSDRVGRFLDAAEVGDAVYAVGETDGTGLFLIEKYDATGSRLWSVESSSRGVLQGVVGVGERVFGIGTTSDSSFGGSDAMVVEFDPNDGSTLSTIYLGGAEDDGAVGAIVIASDLWVAGTTRSYASDDGNAVGQAELALWRVNVN